MDRVIRLGLVLTISLGCWHRKAGVACQLQAEIRPIHEYN